ncbi:MAG: translation initiation factor IF-2 [Chloroflexi bacterium]|nr:translation initiation factor IF-2 [Chloroflexota bacterium]
MSEPIQEKTIDLPLSITVRDLSERLEASPIDVIKTLMANGVMANINQQIDFDTAAIVAAELGFDAQVETLVAKPEKDGDEISLWRQLIAQEDPDKLRARPPVVAILGHVDHGKTTLLDAIRKADVAGGEVGGITQHIGAYQVETNNRTISFIDTPGHAAFTAMRARGAQGADIVVLVVAADDGVMPQTREAIAHAKAAQVPIIVALNKMDRPNAAPDNVKQQLAEVDLVPDDWDGDTIVVPLSAKEKQGLDDLLEAILLVSDNTEIMANPEGKVFGTVIEARHEHGRGVMATLLVQSGTLKIGSIIVVGQSYGRLRAMFDHAGSAIKEAGPSVPVSVMGLDEVPTAGDLFEVVDSMKKARNYVAQQKIADDNLVTYQKREGMTLEQLFAKVEAGEAKELKLIIKTDVQGSLEPIKLALSQLVVGNIGVNVLHADAGAISESDVMLASASDAIIIGFNSQPDNPAQRMAEVHKVSIRSYNIIYRLTEDIEKALKGLLEPEAKETIVGRAKVLAVFRASKLGQVAGCKVADGELRRNAQMRVLRNKETIFEGDVASLKRHQEDVRDVREGFECGVGLKNFNSFQEGDVLECFIIEMVKVI